MGPEFGAVHKSKKIVKKIENDVLKMMFWGYGAFGLGIRYELPV